MEIDCERYYKTQLLHFNVSDCRGGGMDYRDDGGWGEGRRNVNDEWNGYYKPGMAIDLENSQVVTLSVTRQVRQDSSLPTAAELIRADVSRQQGSLPELLKGEAGEIGSKWQDQYGDVVRVRAPSSAWVSDPRALQYIFQTSGYRFIKPQGRKEIRRLITGSGILSAEGDNHKTHRKVLLPGFRGPEDKCYVPVLFTHAGKITYLFENYMIMFAGHETTANTLSWTFLELANIFMCKTDYELRLDQREGRVIFTCGDTEFSVDDLDSMPYLTAVVKNDVVPLSKPVAWTTGKAVQEIAIPKGMTIIVLIAGYSRNKDVWGEDAHVFDPARWLRGSMSKEVPIGVYGNFVLELHAFITETVNNFEFSLTKESERIRREACAIMAPTVNGQAEKGSQLPLRVTMASRD
ncbi:cytochrome P450 [Armillaria novae-zelandiae]|uniref:Cytochrome P450 n=1 Tax=Armillaria novae-zelandiae TaxID=153914 RepID=A0AA39P1G8_9AGAR|nr:cytochrome P450 [Armillaria novae-zelandiae]